MEARPLDQFDQGSDKDPRNDPLSPYFFPQFFQKPKIMEKIYHLSQISKVETVSDVWSDMLHHHFPVMEHRKGFTIRTDKIDNIDQGDHYLATVRSYHLNAGSKEPFFHARMAAPRFMYCEYVWEELEAKLGRTLAERHRMQSKDSIADGQLWGACIVGSLCELFFWHPDSGLRGFEALPNEVLWDKEGQLHTRDKPRHRLHIWDDRHLVAAFLNDIRGRYYKTWGLYEEPVLGLGSLYKDHYCTFLAPRKG